ncbi:MAG TPA: alpha/beta hydrolase [Pseudomonadales bacterium]|nr:alpha/beta hydrolase [Pseudomonadales bacterium]
MHPPIREFSLLLDDGRSLGIGEFGQHDGLPVLWFHGTPGARRQVPLATREYAREHGIRILCIERPGIGLSTPHLYENLCEWGEDMREVADKLGLQRFGLVGLSGGGPYVLATAHAMPERVIAGTIFGGVAPSVGPDAPSGGHVAKAVPVQRALAWLRKPLGWTLSNTVLSLHPFANRVFDTMLRFAPEQEASMLGRQDLRAMFLDDLLLGSKTGIQSIVNDIILFARPWGFSLADIHIPLHFWQGTEDLIVPAEHAEALATRIPGAGFTLCEGQGHLAGLDHTTDALDFILQHDKHNSPHKDKPQVTKKPRNKKHAATE